MNIPIINYRIFLVDFTENTEYAKIISTRKFWLCADFVVACFGHRQVGYAYILKVNAALILIEMEMINFIHFSGHPCIADQSPDYRARLKEAAGGDMNAINEFQPVPPAQFLKYFSL